MRTLSGASLDTGSEFQDEVRAIVASVLGKPVSAVQLDQRLESGLGVDSLAMIDISVSIEEQFQIAMPQSASAAELSVETVGDLARLVETLIGQQSARRGVQ